MGDDHELTQALVKLEYGALHVKRDDQLLDLDGKIYADAGELTAAIRRSLPVSLSSEEGSALAKRVTRNGRIEGSAVLREIWDDRVFDDKHRRFAERAELRSRIPKVRDEDTASARSKLRSASCDEGMREALLKSAPSKSPRALVGLVNKELGLRWTPHQVDAMVKVATRELTRSAAMRALLAEVPSMMPEDTAPTTTTIRRRDDVTTKLRDALLKKKKNGVIDGPTLFFSDDLRAEDREFRDRVHTFLGLSLSPEEAGLLVDKIGLTDHENRNFRWRDFRRTIRDLAATANENFDDHLDALRRRNTTTSSKRRRSEAGISSRDKGMPKGVSRSPEVLVRRRLRKMESLRCRLGQTGGLLDLSLAATEKKSDAISMSNIPVSSLHDLTVDSLSTAPTLTPSETPYFAQALIAALGVIGTEVRHLNLANNTGLTSFPSTACPYLGNLLDLNLAAVGLRELPENIGNLTQLRDLNATANLIAGLPPSIRHLDHLANLALNNNAFFDVPTTLPPYLKVLLLLADNAIDAIPDDFLRNQAASMLHVDLRHNDLACVPRTFFTRCLNHNVDLEVDPEILAGIFSPQLI